MSVHLRETEALHRYIGTTYVRLVSGRANVAGLVLNKLMTFNLFNVIARGGGLESHDLTGVLNLRTVIKDLTVTWYS